MTFGTSNTERMRITSAGNVGIGTDAPISKLQVGTVLSSNKLTIGGYYSQGGGHLAYRSGHGSNSSVWDTAIISATDDGNYNGKIEFKNISFSYGNRKILKDLSFVVNPGHKVAIVGPTGAGKSTISKLIFRFYDPSSGNIFIDDQCLRDVTQSSLRSNIGVVPQDTVMFNDTIKYNISYSKPGSSMTEVENVAKLSSIDKFIADLELGYETVVGERGLKLSGGEKQRVAIARALLKNPKIFIFDEATSALDTKTEKLIEKSLKKLSNKNTTLVIAHRLSTVIDANKIIVLEKGKIAEQGTHKELLQKNGLYAEMWMRQQEQSD